MKRPIILILAAALLLGLCACGRAAVGESEAFTAETAAAAPTAAPAGPPVLSPGAADAAYHSYRFQRGEDGSLYTCLIRTEGVECLYDILPEDIGYIARFIVTGEGIYVTVKSEYFTLDPAALYFYPAGGGDGKLLVEELSSDGVFVMAGDALFYSDYEYGYLNRLDLKGGDPSTVLEEQVRLLDSDGGFIFYGKDDGVYRNDSTFSAEALVFAPAAIDFCAEDGVLCGLTYGADGNQYVELRGTDGAIISSTPLAVSTDNLLCADGMAYVPQPAAQRVLVYDMKTGRAMAEIPLPGLEAYCLIWYAGDNAVWYETMKDGETVLCRADAAGTEVLGPVIIF